MFGKDGWLNKVYKWIDTPEALFNQIVIILYVCHVCFDKAK